MRWFGWSRTSRRRNATMTAGVRAIVTTTEITKLTTVLLIGAPCRWFARFVRSRGASVRLVSIRLGRLRASIDLLP